MTSRLSRRRFIGTVLSATSAALTHSCARSSAVTSQVSPIRRSSSLEITTVKLGLLPLLDAAPLVIAKAKGLFNKYGMTGVELVQHHSWQALQSDIVSEPFGISGAQMPSSLPYLITAGKTEDGKRVRLSILARLNVNGQSIAIANIYRNLNLRLDSSAFKESVERSKARGPGTKLKIAVPCAGGTHDLWLRYWLAAGDIDPDADVTMLVVPPAQMLANMQTGTIHAFCVDDPFALQLVNSRIGYAALTTGELWANHPEKALVMRSSWVNSYPKATQALLMAVQEAQIWCDREVNWAEMLAILSDQQSLQVPQQALLEHLRGNFELRNDRWVRNPSDRSKFWQNQASYPYKSHDAWFVTECIRWGYLPQNTDIQGIVNLVNREDLWRQAAKEIDQGAIVLESAQSRGVETFFDDRQFDPISPITYLNNQPIRKRA